MGNDKNSRTKVTEGDKEESKGGKGELKTSFKAAKVRRVKTLTIYILHVRGPVQSTTIQGCNKNNL